MIDSTHAALLLGIAAKTKDVLARLVYADYLQENSNPGWLIVRSYVWTDWPVSLYMRAYRRRDRDWSELHCYRLPWLDGHVQLDKGYSNPIQRVRMILRAYAEGKAIT